MKKINNIFRIVLTILTIYFIYKYIIDFEIIRLLMSILLILFTWIPIIIKNINEKLIFIYYIYILLLFVFGCLSRFYSIFKYYDVFTHFIFGIASSITGLYILDKFNMYNKKNIIFNIIFMISITLALSSLWEIFEYISSIITKDDVQHVMDTGIKDTMEDIISSFICSIIFTIVYKFKEDKIYKIIR